MDFMAKFGFGNTVQDEYSGFTGKVVGVVFYKTGCVQYLVHPGKLKEDGTILSSEWLNETRLSLAPTDAPPSPTDASGETHYSPSVAN